MGASTLVACGGESDDFDGGRVLSREDRGDGCEYITYEVAPEWECTEEQLARVEAVYGTVINQTNYGGYHGDSVGVERGPATPPLPFEEAVEQESELKGASCSELAELKRELIRGANDRYLTSQATKALLPCLPVRKSAYLQDGEEVEYCSNDSGNYAADSAGWATGSGGTSGAQAEGATEYSTTNNQVVGVEEADYVKNDSGHVFVLTPGALRVFDTWPVDETSEIARVALDAEPRRLLLAGSELVVFSRVMASNAGYGSYEYDYNAEAFGTGNPSSQGCTYGYDCRFVSEGGSTKIEVFDVSNPANPTLLRGYALSGAYVASRRIDRVVHLVVHNGGGESALLLDEIRAELGEGKPELVLEREAALRAKMNDTIDEIPDDELLPRAEDDEQRKGTCEDALAAAGADGSSIVSLVSFDLDDLAELERTLIAAAPGYVYASADALYLATDGVSADGSWAYYRAPADRDISAIHKFALDGASTTYQGSALIRGHVLNQFAMDEHEGVLRVASTSGWVPDEDVRSTLTTLHEVDGRLRRYGELTGLAPTEDIRSVRFDGERGFVVTFKKTDPLFAFDLSDPAEPTVLGELKIPGFSTYMHPLDADHLLAVGFDADDHGDFAYFDGIQIQMFDVSDMTQPTLLHKTVIGTRGSGSEALLNHLAFNYFAARQQLALPITVCEGGDDGVYGSTMTFSGLMVFDVSIADGITERGRMPFADPVAAADAGYYYGAGGCAQWWSQSSSTVKRSIFFEDYVFGLSDTEMRAAQVDSMQTLLVNLPLVDGSTAPTSAYPGY